MATFEHYRQQFAENVRDLAGAPNRSILPQLVARESLTGSVAYLDFEKPDTAKGASDLKAKATRDAFESGLDAKGDSFTNGTLSSFNSIFTPHDQTIKERTLIQPQLIEYGHNFDEDVDILNIVDPANSTVRNMMRNVYKDEDNLIINAIKAATVSRVTSSSTNETSPTNIAFPTSQKIGAGGEDFGSSDSTFITLDDIGRIRELMETQYVDSKVYCLISPTTKRLMRANITALTDSDFVGATAFFTGGGLPDVDGITFISHPSILATEFYAFTADSIVFNTFNPLTTSLNEIAVQRNSIQAYIREKVDAKRVDDLGVVFGEIQAIS